MPNRSHIILKLSTALVLLMTACGGGAGGGTIAIAPAAPVTPPAITPAPPITNFTVSSTAAAVQSSVPITLGQPFKAGDLPAGSQLEARDAAGNSVPLQMDEVSSHADGSVRFAVLSTQLSNLQANEQRVVNLYRASAVSTPAAPNMNTAAYDMKLAAIVYTPQVTQITFGNRSGTTAGTPYVEGEVITLQLGVAPVEQYTLTVSAAQAGGGFQSLTKIAEAFLTLVNSKSTSYRAYKIGSGGGYENLWITSVAPSGKAFSVSFVYSGQAKQTIIQQQAYAPPRSYVADPRPVLDTQLASNQRPRLYGATAIEYTLVAPFVEIGTGIKHPQLTARLHTRFLNAGQRVRTDLVIENNWTYEPNPGNVTYSLTVTQGGQTILQQAPFTHNHHARWHKVLWSGAEPQVFVRHDMRYFLDSRATWNYDLSLAIPESVLAAEAVNLAKADTTPMGAAFITPYFPTTGGRSDIGPLPRWTALFLVTQDPRARASMLANADAAAGIPIHYRDLPTDQPVSLDKHPDLAMSIGSSTTVDALPIVINGATIWSPEAAHQASFSYIPYMVSGDTFYLDETQFWANWNMGRVNPSYRGRNNGLIFENEMRGQAWSLRSIGEATFALPDNHPMKGYFKTKLNTNLAWYVARYPRDSTNTVSPLGMMEKNDAVGQTAPWQNDFMALVVGQLAEAGDIQAREYFNWISRFTVGRFLNESAGFCRAQAPGYYITIRDASNRFITDWGLLFRTNWPTITSCDPKRVVDGVPTSPSDYAAYARAMLGTSVGLGISGADAAYSYWNNVTPQMRNAMLGDPTWAIIPRIN
jgi:Flp pilus assembly pilin Flp